jgi:hypothetical protein
VSKSTYKVTGSTAYAGHKPGEEFEAELPADQERRAVERGSIRVVRRGEKSKGKEGGDAEEGAAT